MDWSWQLEKVEVLLVVSGLDVDRSVEANLNQSSAYNLIPCHVAAVMNSGQ